MSQRAAKSLSRQCSAQHVKGVTARPSRNPRVSLARPMAWSLARPGTQVSHMIRGDALSHAPSQVSVVPMD